MTAEAVHMAVTVEAAAEGIKTLKSEGEWIQFVTHVLITAMLYACPYLYIFWYLGP